ncbi:MAG TPA: ribosome maturation factor RimM [Methylibium sp.]|uniref:ribosome maturation factor RimM n=1 Tax=Methylibium sp. TaxID=2067992 RepID=UPI002DBFB5E1|nr:ribosome maturation factor RimM [Methylibium sp.]HEU4458170.1 ribosome maturation factor RimM [Methylibium sp.]
MSGPGAAEAEEAWPADAIEVGRVLDAWGVKGAIKVQAFAKDPQALFSSRRWHLQPPDGARGASRRLLRITSAREQADVIVAQSREIEDRDAAEALRGWRVFVARSSFPTADADEYYWVDLIGLEVLNREGVVLGRVADLLDTGAHSVLRIESEDGVERLIPFVAHYVDEVSLAARRIVVDWGADWHEG